MVPIKTTFDTYAHLLRISTRLPPTGSTRCGTPLMRTQSEREVIEFQTK